MADDISKVDNPWREFIENCIDGSNYFRSSEYRQLLADLDRLYRLESATTPAEVDVRLRLMKTVAGNVVKDGVGACDALYSLATEHGAAPQGAAGFAHHVNGALALLEDDVAKACELTATLARQLAYSEEANATLKTMCAAAEAHAERAESQLAEATRRLGEVEGLLRRYRDEVPLGHQPHMIAHLVDAALKEPK